MLSLKPGKSMPITLLGGEWNFKIYVEIFNEMYYVSGTFPRQQKLFLVRV